MTDQETPSTTESSHVCPEYTAIVPFGVREPLPCLLRAPHKGYRHYAVHPDHPDRFWIWDDVIQPVDDGRKAESVTPAKSSGEVVDLLAALQRSVDAAKANREVRSPSGPLTDLPAQD